MDAVKLILVDDHTVAREALAMALKQESGFDVVGSWPDAESALASTTPFDLAIVDYRLPGMDGNRATRRLRELHPQAPVIILSGFCREEQILEAFEAGAAGFLPKEVSIAELIETLRAVLQGQTILSPRVARRILEYCTSSKRANGHPGLKESHIEVLRLAGCGYANKEIAEHLYIPVDTVKQRLKEAFHYLGARDRTQAVLAALRHGLFELEDCE